jgi:phosphatidylglycerol:prolipoprotein diacylglycerol transferase
MSFHGGFAGTALAIYVLAKRKRISVLSLADVCAAAVPVGLFLGRIANFIKPELWGRPADVPWAMVFPGAGPSPRHPSQLYEAGLEGVVLFLLLYVAVHMGALRRPGLVAGLFAAGYGIARIACEFFREPDPQLGFLFGGATMGMLLSLPLIAVGFIFIVRAYRRPTGRGMNRPA